MITITELATINLKLVKIANEVFGIDSNFPTSKIINYYDPKNNVVVSVIHVNFKRCGIYIPLVNINIENIEESFRKIRIAAELNYEKTSDMLCEKIMEHVMTDIGG